MRIIVGLFFLICVGWRAEVPLSDHNEKMKGLCWVGGDSISYHNIQQVTEVGASWISQTPFGWMGAYNEPEIRMNTKKAWWGESDRGLIHTTRLAKKSGVRVMLKPHIWLRSRDGKWRSDIKMQNEEDWNTWFENYEKFIVHYARLAEREHIESLCIGTELYETTRLKPEKWRKIIKAIRKVYSGDLVYAANWYKEFETISFWDDLDYIGIQAYFPLTKKKHPSKKDLIKSWRNHKKAIEKVSRKYDRDVIFTEIGYKNTANAAIEPWSWPQHLRDQTIKISEETQAICYHALFESTWSEPWLKGIFIWKWFHSTYKYQSFDSYFEARQLRRKKYYADRNIKNGPTIQFTPQQKSAMDVLQTWYCK